MNFDILIHNMGELDLTPLADAGAPRHLLTDQKTPLELDQIPQELSQLLNEAYNGITQKLQTGGRVKEEAVPTRPAIYICKRNDLETMNRLSGTKSFPAHHFVRALYFAIPHAIFFPISSPGVIQSAPARLTGHNLAQR